MRDRRLGSFLWTLCATVTFLVASCSEHDPVTSPEKTAEGIADADGTARSADPGLIASRSGKITVCHVDEFGASHLIAINPNAWPAHSAHGDAQVVDADGDGWAQADNACVPGGDCDDQDPDVHPGAEETFCDGIDRNCNGSADEGGFTVVGYHTADIRRDNPARQHESAMGNLVADVMRLRYPNVDGAMVNSGALREDLIYHSDGSPGEILCREAFAVLPFGNRTAILTLTGAQLEQAFLNGFLAMCNVSVGGTGRFPQISGLKVSYHCNGLTSVVTGMWKTPQGIGGPQIPIGPTDTVRLVTSDFMAAGNDGYSVLQQGTNLVEPGETLLQVLLDYMAAHSPISAAVEGRIIGPGPF